MSALTDTLTHAQDTLLASGRELPAADLRTFTSMLIAAIGGLEQRARGNRIFYTSGKPSDSLGLEGDFGVNAANGDFYGFKDGVFTFLFNGLGKEGAFTPIAQDAFGTHPVFTSQKAFDEWVLANIGKATGTPTAPGAPTDLSVTAERVVSFTPAAGKTATDYEQQFTATT